MPPGPKVSVIMAAYNVADWIDEAVASVLSQSLTDWELIIVNDGSTDATSERINAFTDPRIATIHQPNRGVSAARNVALAHARGQYAVFLDADDHLPADSLAIRTAYLDAHPEVDILNGAVSRRSADLKAEISLYRPDTVIQPLFPALVRLNANVFLGVVYMVRRDMIGTIRFDETLTHMEDVVFFLDIAKAQNAIYAAVPQTIYNYRQTGASSMQFVDRLELAYLKFSSFAPVRYGLSPATTFALRRRIARILFATRVRQKQLLKGLIVACLAVFGCIPALRTSRE